MATSLDRSYNRALKATKKPRGPQLPKRLAHLKSLPFARFIGKSPGGTDWVAYKQKDVVPMRKRLAALKEKHGIPRRVSGLTENQIYMVDDELDVAQGGYKRSDPLFVMGTIKTGRTYVEGSRDDLAEMRERIEDRLDEDHQAIIEGATVDKDLTDAQVRFGVNARIKSIKSLLKKLG